MKFRSFRSWEYLLYCNSKIMFKYSTMKIEQSIQTVDFFVYDDWNFFSVGTLSTVTRKGQFFTTFLSSRYTSFSRALARSRLMMQLLSCKSPYVGARIVTTGSKPFEVEFEFQICFLIFHPDQTKELRQFNLYKKHSNFNLEF